MDEETLLLETVSKCEQGMDIEDAWKCPICCFPDTCNWRIAKGYEVNVGKRKD